MHIEFASSDAMVCVIAWPAYRRHREKVLNMAQLESGVIRARVEQDWQRIVDVLNRKIALQSVSAHGITADHMKRSAEFVAEQMREVDVDAKVAQSHNPDGTPGALADKTVRVIMLTGGSRQWYESDGIGESLDNQICRQTFAKYCGVKDVELVYVDNLSMGDDSSDKRKAAAAQLEGIRQLGASLA